MKSASQPVAYAIPACDVFCWKERVCPSSCILKPNYKFSIVCSGIIVFGLHVNHRSVLFSSYVLKGLHCLLHGCGGAAMQNSDGHLLAAERERNAQEKGNARSSLPLTLLTIPAPHTSLGTTAPATPPLTFRAATSVGKRSW